MLKRWKVRIKVLTCTKICTYIFISLYDFSDHHHHRQIVRKLKHSYHIIYYSSHSFRVKVACSSLHHADGLGSNLARGFSTLCLGCPGFVSYLVRKNEEPQNKTKKYTCTLLNYIVLDYAAIDLQFDSLKTGRNSASPCIWVETPSMPVHYSPFRHLFKIH